MAAPVLHLPLDFERRESVRLFGRKLTEIPGGAALSDRAPLYALRIWLDWAGAGAEFRSLRRALADGVDVDWTKEDLTYVIEGAAGWLGAPGELIKAALEGGFLKLTRRGEGNELCLSLDGFWPLNQHLSPDYMSIQRRGGHASVARRLAKEAELEAERRNELDEQQGRLPFGKETVTANEKVDCYALVIRLYRVCGLTAPAPDSEKFTESIMRDALWVVRKFSKDQILDVETYLLANRDNPEVVKVPEVIMRSFGIYAESAKAE
jgi:hypothetical protein